MNENENDESTRLTFNGKLFTGWAANGLLLLFVVALMALGYALGSIR